MSDTVTTQSILLIQQQDKIFLKNLFGRDPPHSPYRSFAIEERKLIRRAASRRTAKTAVVDTALFQLRLVRQRKPMSKPARLEAPTTRVKMISTVVKCPDMTFAQPRRHSQSHQQQPHEETWKRGPLRDLALPEPQHNWEPQWQSLHCMAKDSVAHDADNVQGQQHQQGAIADCLRCIHCRIIYKTSSSEVSTKDRSIRHCGTRLGKSNFSCPHSWRPLRSGLNSRRISF